MTDETSFENMKAAYHTLGCKLNFAETSTIGKLLAERGVTTAREGEMPDICVVNTCTVTELANKKCRQEIRRLSKLYPNATMVVTGCYAQLNAPEVAALEGVAIVAGNDRKGEIADFVDRWLAERQKVVEVSPLKEMKRFVPSCSRGDRTRFFLKVQDGCDYYCSYCTIPRARGRSRSGSIAQLVEQARDAAAEGGREIVVTGVNIGDFGKSDAAGRADRFQRRNQIIVVEQRLPDPHDDDIVGRASDQAAAEQIFLDDFPGMQIAHKTRGAACAERAADRTADLRAEAECHAPVLGGNQGALHGFAVEQRKQKLPRTVRRNIIPFHCKCGTEKMRADPLPERSGQIAHPLRIGHPFPRNPVIELFRAVGALSDFRNEIRGLFRRDSREKRTDRIIRNRYSGSRCFRVRLFCH